MTIAPPTRCSLSRMLTSPSPSFPSRAEVETDPVVDDPH
jgi:hypothetical protein